jgi:putative ABC transport system permease protein
MSALPPPVARLVRAIVRLYPRALREEYGDDILAMLDDMWRLERPAGRVAAAVWLVRHVWRVGVAGVASHADRWRERVASAAGDGPGLRPSPRRARGPFVGLGHDLRLTGRVIARQPGFAVLTIATLALGIGATTTIYALAYHVWLKPLPYANADRLVMIDDVDTRTGSGSGLADPEIADYRAATSLADVAHSWYGADVFRDGGEPTETLVYEVSPNLFTVLGAAPALGRPFTPADVRDPNPVAILSDTLWRHAYGADPHIVGRTLHAVHMTATVVGVMPPDFRYPFYSDGGMWIPVRPSRVSPDRHVRGARVIGLLKPGATLDGLRGELAVIGTRLATAYPATNQDWSPRATPLADFLLGGMSTAFGTLLVAVGLLLLMTCANVAGLLLARHAARRHDVVVRAALGATRWRLARLAMAESLVVSAIGGVAGVCVARVAAPLIASFVPVARLAGVRVDAHVLFAAVVVTMTTGMACGLIPAVGRIRSLPRLRTAAPPMTTSRATRRTQRALVVAQIAVSLVLAAAGGLMVKSFVALLHVDRGFSSDHVLSLTVSAWPSSRVQHYDSSGAFFHDVIDAVSRLHGVASAGFATGAPATQLGYWGTASLTASPDQPSTGVSAQIRAVSPGYFRTLDVPLVAGRFFTDRDDAHASPVAIVTQTVARTLWPDGTAIGRTIALPPIAGGRPLLAAPYEIVGVVGDMRVYSSTRPDPGVFVPFFQTPGFWADIVVRTTGEPAAMASQVHSAVRRLDPDVVIDNMAPMTSLIDQRYDLPQAEVLLVSLFAMLAIAIASTGVYGVLSYLVTERTAEFGLRAALGATPGDVLGDVIRRGLTLGIAGTVIGGVGTLLASRLLRHRVFGLESADPRVLAAAGAALLAMTFVASYFPARRAMAIDPSRALAQPDP